MNSSSIKHSASKDAIGFEELNRSLPAADWPRFSNLCITDMLFECDLSIGADLSYLAGHFPQQAVVPGVVQVHWVGELARRFFSCDGFASLKKVKFSNVILPQMALSLKIDYRADIANCRFEYYDDQQVYSSGVLVFSVDGCATENE